jgi:hypothetical protein
MSPGPVYDKPPAIESRPAGIGERPTQTASEKQPGPADYFETPITPHPPPLCGFYGPTDRCPVNLDHEKQKPGAGYYEQPGQFERFERGYYFTSRTMDDFVPDTGAPYQGQRSTLGGPRWTIGSKNI